MIGASRDPGSGAEAQIEGTPTTAFGKYQLFASLGRGGMADVFLSVARGQMGFNKLAVVKRLRQALAEEAAFRNMFLDEARLAARLNHPNIVHTYEVGEQNGVYFIAMEYLEGQSLNKVLKEALRRNEVLEPELCVRIIADALAGLHHAHELRDYDGRPLSIIHRDVSPHNIFVTYDGHTKLVDFGIAKAALSSTETEVGVLKGKVAYMSPEQAVGGRIDCRSDLFAMGIVLWELLARQRLMTGENPANTLHKLMNEPIPRLSHALPGVDPELDAIVSRALEKEPSLRFQSAAEMREVLETWLAHQPRPARTEDVARRMQHIFSSVREEVHRQIQKHMGAITSASNTQELQALTAESLQRMEQSGANVSGQLLRLNGPGSGSGVVPSYGGSGRGYGMGTPPPQSNPPQGDKAEKKDTLLIVIAVGFFVLSATAIVVIGLRDRRRAEPVEVVPPAVATFVPPIVSPPPATVLDPTQPVATSAAPAPLATATTVATSDPTVAPPPATAATTRPSSPHHTSTSPRPTSAATTVKPLPQAVPPPPVPEKEDPGFLTINSYPWAKVSEGGRVICPATPCSKVGLSAGTHTLVVENAEQGLKQTISVPIKSGETTTRAVGFK